MRLNISKSGIGVSAGVKGFRVGVGPRGGTMRVSVPGTGIGYEVRTKAGKRQRSRTVKSQTVKSQSVATEQDQHEPRRGHPWLWILAGLATMAVTGSPWALILVAWGLVIAIRGRRRNQVPPEVSSS